jgi:hypothetical protein
MGTLYDAGGSLYDLAVGEPLSLPVQVPSHADATCGQVALQLGPADRIIAGTLLSIASGKLAVSKDALDRPRLWDTLCAIAQLVASAPNSQSLAPVPRPSNFALARLLDQLLLLLSCP